MIDSVARGRQRLHKHGARLRLQASANDDHTVFVLIHMQRPAPVALGRLSDLRLAVDVAPRADDAFDVRRGACLANFQQPVFGLRARHTSQCSNLRVRELAAGERFRQPRQRSERARHPDMLARCAGGQADPSRQPLGARAKAASPPSVFCADCTPRFFAAWAASGTAIIVRTPHPTGQRTYTVSAAMTAARGPLCGVYATTLIGNL